MDTEIRVIDLFTGAGGLTEGWRRAARSAAVSTRTVAAVEFDPLAAATYAANFGDEAQFVAPIEDWLANHDVPTADVILGGPPCQGFSHLGPRDINDERNFLWLKYAETIVRSQPKYFVVENVAPFLKSPQFEAFRASTGPGGILSDYAIEPHVLTAADFGAPQNRRRTVIIGRHRDLPATGAVRTTHEGAWQSVEDAFTRADIRIAVDGYELPDRRTASGFRGTFRSDELHLGRNYTNLSLKRFACIPEGGNRHHIDPELLPKCWKGYTTGASDVMGRLHWDRPAVTIRTEFFKPEKGRYLHPVADRAITHFEAATLQGFPPEFRWVGSKTAIAKQIGNAVPVQLAEAVSSHVLDALVSD